MCVYRTTSLIGGDRKLMLKTIANISRLKNTDVKSSAKEAAERENYYWAHLQA